MKRELAEPISLDGMWDFIHAGPEPARVRRALVPALVVAGHTGHELLRAGVVQRLDLGEEVDRIAGPQG